jgi:hypothetical protein
MACTLKCVRAFSLMAVPAPHRLPGAPSTPEISVVVPVYCNAETLEELYGRLSQTLATGGFSFEVIFVEDAGPDGSLAVLKTLAAADPRVGLIAMAANLGQHGAIMIGLGYARGSRTVIMDADLQDPPEAIPALLAAGRSGPAAVFAGRRGAYESASRLFSSRLYRWLLRRLTGLPADAGIFVAIDSPMREYLLKMAGPYPSIVAMIGCTGLPVRSIPVPRMPRPRGRSAYDWRGRLKSGLRALAWVADWKLRPLTRRPRLLETPACAGWRRHAPAYHCFGACFEHTDQLFPEVAS